MAEISWYNEVFEDDDDFENKEKLKASIKKMRDRRKISDKMRREQEELMEKNMPGKK